MKVGLIPPLNHLNDFSVGPFHLTLAHLFEFKGYRDHYRQQVKKGAHVVIDNSAHEFGQGGRFDRLLSYALDTGAQEVVCPDVLFEAEGTLVYSMAAMEAFAEGLETTPEISSIQLMMVPQAKSIYEWGWCCKRLVETHVTLFGSVRRFTLGISKDYEMWQGGLPNLLQRFVEPLKGQYEFEVHLLGWTRRLPMLASLSHRFPWIRSVDSAKPFVYALHNIRLSLTSPTPEYPRRPPDYFTRRFDDRQLAAAIHNVDIFTRAAEGELK